jgi:hypothetical protein
MQTIRENWNRSRSGSGGEGRASRCSIILQNSFKNCIFWLPCQIDVVLSYKVLHTCRARRRPIDRTAECPRVWPPDRDLGAAIAEAPSTPGSLAAYVLECANYLQ